MLPGNRIILWQSSIQLKEVDFSNKITESIGESGQKHRVLKIAGPAIHEGLTRNQVFYSAETLSGAPISSESNLPLLLDHNDKETDACIGRVRKLEFRQSEMGQPSYVWFEADITSEAAIDKIKREQLLKVSIGGMVRRLECSICGKTVAEGCKHMRGVIYEGRKCFAKAIGLEIVELSFVNVSGDKNAGVQYIGEGEIKSYGQLRTMDDVLSDEEKAKIRSLTMSERAELIDDRGNVIRESETSGVSNAVKEIVQEEKTKNDFNNETKKGESSMSTKEIQEALTRIETLQERNTELRLENSGQKEKIETLEVKTAEFEKTKEAAVASAVADKDSVIEKLNSQIEEMQEKLDEIERIKKEALLVRFKEAKTQLIKNNNTEKLDEKQIQETVDIEVGKIREHSEDVIMMILAQMEEMIKPKAKENAEGEEASADPAEGEEASADPAEGEEKIPIEGEEDEINTEEGDKLIFSEESLELEPEAIEQLAGLTLEEFNGMFEGGNLSKEEFEAFIAGVRKEGKVSAVKLKAGEENPLPEKRGEKFKTCHSVMTKKGLKNSESLCAAIGRSKYAKAGYQQKPVAEKALVINLTEMGDDLIFEEVLKLTQEDVAFISGMTLEDFNGIFDYEANLTQEEFDAFIVGVKANGELTPGSLKGLKKSLPEGRGARFKSSVESMSKKEGVTNPRVLCAAIGRTKYGKAGFGKLAEAGRQAGTGEKGKNLQNNEGTGITQEDLQIFEDFYIVEQGIADDPDYQACIRTAGGDPKKMAACRAAAIAKMRTNPAAPPAAPGTPAAPTPVMQKQKHSAEANTGSVKEDASTDVKETTEKGVSLDNTEKQSESKQKNKKSVDESSNSGIKEAYSQKVGILQSILKSSKSRRR